MLSKETYNTNIHTHIHIVVGIRYIAVYLEIVGAVKLRDTRGRAKANKMQKDV